MSLLFVLKTTSIEHLTAKLFSHTRAKRFVQWLDTLVFQYVYKNKLHVWKCFCATLIHNVFTNTLFRRISQIDTITCGFLLLVSWLHTKKYNFSVCLKELNIWALLCFKRIIINFANTPTTADDKLVGCRQVTNRSVANACVGVKDNDYLLLW